MNDERRMDGDKFVEFVFRETNDTDLTNTVKNLVNEYLNRRVPQVSLGQEVWIVNGYDKHWRIIKGCIVRIQLWFTIMTGVVVQRIRRTVLGRRSFLQKRMQRKQ